jgi:CRP-like cAMP-binding protein
MADMISRMTHTKLEVGECAVKQGETGKSFYVVRSGSVDVKIAPPGQSEAQKVATLASGQYFGERSLLTSEPANATVMAAEPTDLMGLDRQAFEEILGPLQELIERVAAEREAQNKAKTSTKYGWADLDLRQVTRPARSARPREGTGKRVTARRCAWLASGVGLPRKRQATC